MNNPPFDLQIGDAVYTLFLPDRYGSDNNERLIASHYL